MSTMTPSRLELLPAEIIAQILGDPDLTPEILAEVSQVSRRLRAHAKQDSLWKPKLEALAGTALPLTEGLSSYHELYRSIDPFWW